MKGENHNLILKYSVAVFFCIALFLVLGVFFGFDLAFNLILGVPLLFFVPGFLLLHLFFNVSELKNEEKIFIAIVLSVFFTPFVIFVLFQLGISFSLLSAYLAIFGISFALLAGIALKRRFVSYKNRK